MYIGTIHPARKRNAIALRTGVDSYASPITAPLRLPVTALAPTQPQQSPAPVTEVDVELAEATALTPRYKPPVFRVGDRCRYCGPEGAMAVTCRGKELKVLNIRINDQGEQDAEVKAQPWCTSYWVTSRHLKLKLGDCHE